MLIRTALLGGLLAFAVLAQPALAQGLFKSTMPDGKVIYGDKPAPGAVKVDKLKAQTTKGITGPTAKEAAVLRDLEKSRAARDNRENKIRAAEDAVSRAEAALAAGKEPLPGDRIGTAGGKSRLTDGYLERQKQLEQDVAKARANLAIARADPVAQQKSTVKETDVPPDGVSQRALRDR